MKAKRIVLFSLLLPSLLLAGCQRAEASSTVEATSYKKVYNRVPNTDKVYLDYFIFYGRNGHKYVIDNNCVEYKYDINMSNHSKAKAVIKTGELVTAVITLPVSQDRGME